MNRSAVATLVVGLGAMLVPSMALANALIPAINTYRDSPDFYWLFTAIVIIEGLSLRLMLRDMHLASVLWRTALLNLASSLVGYLIMRSPLQPSISYGWRFFLPFFLITVAVEWPLTLGLFRGGTSCKRVSITVIVMNILSYVFLLLAEPALTGQRVNELQATDRALLAEWNDASLLKEATGLIYGTESEGHNRVPPHRLRVLDPTVGDWQSLPACPPLHPSHWDVEGALLAFVGLVPYGEEDPSPGSVRILDLPDFTEVTSIPRSDPGYVINVDMSPNGKHVAVARQLHEITAPLRGSSYRVLGIISRIAIYDTRSGELIVSCPRAAAGGSLCWHPDSTTLFFASLADTGLHRTRELRKGWKRRGEDVAFNDVRTYAFDIENGRITHFERTVPVVAAEARVLVFQSGQEHIILHDADTGRDRYIYIGNMARQSPRISPDGRFAIVGCELQNPFAHFGHPTIVDLSNPSRRYALGWDYRFQWVSNRF